MPLGASRIPCSAGPQPHLAPVSCGSSGAGTVMAGDTEAQDTQDLKATTSPVVASGGTSHRFPASRTPVLPLGGCLCPPSLPPPLPTLDLEASHRTERGQLCHISEGCSFRGQEPHLVLPDVPHQFFTTLELLQHWSPFQGPNAGVWPGKDGCAWTYWKFYTGVAVPSAWPRATSHGLPRDSRTCQWTRSSRNNQRRSSFNVIPPLLCALKSHIHVGCPGLDG